MVSHWLISPASADANSPLLQRHDGFVSACGSIIYYETIGNGRPLLVLHGGPGLSHTYFLPYLLPLAKHHRLIFLDERGSGRSQRLSDLSGYTLENMACDANAVRRALDVKTLDVMGHSFGGVLAQEYVIKYPSAVRRLVLASTWSSASRINEDFLAHQELDRPGIEGSDRDDGAEKHHWSGWSPATGISQTRR